MYWCKYFPFERDVCDICDYDQLKTLQTSCNHSKEIILLGDFNVNWDNKKDRKHLKHITNYFNLSQITEQPTRVTHHTQSRIDLGFTNKPERIAKIHNLLTGLSDHSAIFFSGKVKCSKISVPYFNQLIY